MTTRPLCIYHANCIDGFAAAWVVRKAFHGVVDFHPGIYGEPPPDVRGREVFLVDFSYKRQILLQMIEAAASVTILDHHATAEADLAELPGAITVFDMDRCGAMLTWRFFFINEAPPRLLMHIQDRDLWRFNLQGSREITAGLYSHPFDFGLWDDFMRPDAIPFLNSDGEAIIRQQAKDLASMLPVLTRRMNISGFNVPAANLPWMYASEAGHILADGEPFAATYFDTPLGRTFSLRSARNGRDVSKIAERFGGGGHKGAAGFRLSPRDARRMERENYDGEGRGS